MEYLDSEPVQIFEATWLSATEAFKLESYPWKKKIHGMTDQGSNVTLESRPVLFLPWL